MIQTKHRRLATRLQRFTMPSMTIPDQTMSLKTLLTKYSRGMPISAPNMQMEFTGETVAHDFSKMDLADRETLTLNAIDELKELKAKESTLRAENLRKQQETAQKQAKRIEELEKELQSKNSINNT